jgi:hypothetical protein
MRKLLLSVQVVNHREVRGIMETSNMSLRSMDRGPEAEAAGVLLSIFQEQNCARPCLNSPQGRVPNFAFSVDHASSSAANSTLSNTSSDSTEFPEKPADAIAEKAPEAAYSIKSKRESPRLKDSFAANSTLSNTSSDSSQFPEKPAATIAEKEPAYWIKSPNGRLYLQSALRESLRFKWSVCTAT